MKPQEREVARELRLQGMPLKKIAVHLRVSSGSVFKWCQDIVLTEEQKRRLWCPPGQSPAGSRLDRRRERGRVNASSAYSKRRQEINELKMSRGCIDCGYAKHPAALQFDHVDPSSKRFRISTSMNRRWEDVLEEIAKCEVRCANCHAVKTVEAQRHLLQAGGRKSVW